MPHARALFSNSSAWVVRVWRAEPTWRLLQSKIISSWILNVSRTEGQVFCKLPKGWRRGPLVFSPVRAVIKWEICTSYIWWRHINHTISRIFVRIEVAPKNSPVLLIVVSQHIPYIWSFISKYLRLKKHVLDQNPKNSLNELPQEENQLYLLDQGSLHWQQFF